MYKTRWAKEEEFNVILDYWYEMAYEMGESDEVPKPDQQRYEEVRSLFMKESKLGNLMFRVAVDKDDNIVACAGGLLRKEYAYPLSDEQSLFGWIISVYTSKNHRNNRLANKLVDEVCLWLKEKGVQKVRLWASSPGRRVYEKLGFKNMMYMEKEL